MKDCIFELADGTQVLVLDEQDVNNKKYVLVTEVDLNNDKVSYDEMYYLIAEPVDNNIRLREITDDEMLGVLPTLLKNKQSMSIN